MISGDRPAQLLSLVSFAGILALLSFALWPVFLTSLGPEWGLSNTDIGLVSGAYFFGYLLATPILVGLTDHVDAKLRQPAAPKAQPPKNISLASMRSVKPTKTGVAIK